MIRKQRKRSPKKLIEFTRIWLERNKVFFEVIASLLLMIMALIISIEANNIATNQTKIMKAEQLPIIHVDSDLEFDPSKDFYTKEKITVNNLGSALSNPPLIEHKVFFLVYYGPSSYEVKKVFVPVENYYSTQFVTNNLTGTLAVIENSNITEGNNFKSFHLIKDFSKYAEQKKAFGFIEVIQYVVVHYTDIFDENHKDVFLVGGTETIKIAEQNHNIINEFNIKRDKQQFVDFNNTNAENLYSQWLKISTDPDNKKGNTGFY